ncbi:MAG: hypothetical protein ACE5F9_01150 [Phycisphaerae bacterium]
MRARLKHPLWALAGLAVLMSVAFPVYLALCSRERVVIHVSDDAYYYFNVAMHIAAGDGPTADGVTKTTGFHPLYCFLLAGLHRLTDPSLDGFIDEAVALNAACNLLAGLFLFLAARRWWGTAAGLVAAVLWLANPHVTKIMGAGLEGSVYAMTLSLLLWRLIVLVRADIGGSGRHVAQCVVLGACGGLVMLSRTDAALLMPWVALVMLIAAPKVRLPVRLVGVGAFSLLALALFGLWLWYAWAETGSIVQGSAAAKMAWREVARSQVSAWQWAAHSAGTFGVYVGKAFIKTPALKWVLSGIPLLLLAGGPRRVRAERWLLHLLWLIPLVLGLAYALFAERPRTWYYVPCLVTLTILSGGAANALRRVTHPGALQALVRRAAPLLVWLVVVESTAVFVQGAVFGRSSEQAFAVRALGWLEKHVPAGSTLGCWHSGIIQYYTPELTIINLDGLANNEILPVLRGEKTMNAYWDERGIEFVVGKPNSKMEHYALEWDGKKLIDYGPFPMAHKIRRIVPAAGHRPGGG